MADVIDLTKFRTEAVRQAAGLPRHGIRMVAGDDGKYIAIRWLDDDGEIRMRANLTLAETRALCDDLDKEIRYAKEIGRSVHGTTSSQVCLVETVSTEIRDA